MDLNTDESFYKTINEQRKLLNEIKNSNGRMTLKTQHLIESIAHAANNDYEYSWYYENNQVINYFLLDCFDVILNSFFVLDSKVTNNAVKIISTMLLCTRVQDSYKFKSDWLNINYKSFFSDILAVVHYGLDKYVIGKDMELVESILVIVSYIIVVIPLDKLIKCGFINTTIHFMIKYIHDCYLISLKVIEVLLSKLSNVDEYRNAFEGLNKKQQINYLKLIGKCLRDLLSYDKMKGSVNQWGIFHVLNQKIQFNQILFESLAKYSQTVDNYIKMNQDLKGVLLTFDLLERMSLFINSLSLTYVLDLSEESRFNDNVITFLKSVMFYDLSFILNNVKLSNQRCYVILIMKKLISAFREIEPAPLLSDITKKEKDLIMQKLESIRNISEKLASVPTDNKKDDANTAFRYLIDNNLLDIFEHLIWVLCFIKFDRYSENIRNKFAITVESFNQLLNVCFK